jgi:acyl-CoA synthetase (AMP-forming)/AMP-acid ligase II
VSAGSVRIGWGAWRRRAERGLGALSSIGPSVGALGKSGLLGPYRPDQLVRLATTLPRVGADIGSLYHLRAALDPDRVAAIDDAGEASFAEMDRRSAALAAGLAGLGVGAASTVGVGCRNHRGLLLAMAALGRLGATTVYLNTGFAGPQLADVVACEGIDALILDEDLLDVADALDPAVPVVVAWWERPATSRRWTTLSELLDADPADAPPPPLRPARQVLLTSGTTGRPKGASRSLPDPTPGLGLLARIPYRRGDVTVLAAPAFHAWGLANAVIGLLLGATLVLPRRFDAEDTLARIAAHRARVLVAVPVMLQRILELPAEVRSRYDTSSLRVVALSGSALPGDLATRFMDAFGDVVYSLYGSTEVGPVAVAGPAELRAAPRTAGRLLPGVEVAILDDGDTPVGRGGSGRLFVRSGLSSARYTDGSGKRVVDGFVSSGDVGHLDERGWLVVDGRDDDMIVSGGENVFPKEVEDLLASHPGVSEVAVLGVPDDRFGQRLEAWVVPADPDLGADDLLELVRTHLARHKVPRALHLVDGLPRTTTGKVLKRDLAAGA